MFFHLLLRLLSILPLGWLQDAGAVLGKIFIRCNSKRANIVRRNITLCFPYLSPKQQQLLVEQSSGELGKWLMECPYAWLRDSNAIAAKISVSNGKLLKEAKQKNHGVLIVVPHLGNFEFINHYLANTCHFASFYRPHSNKNIETISHQARTQIGATMIPANRQGLKSAYQHLRSGNVLTILPDHLPSKTAGVFAPFFGVPAHTGRLTHSLLRNTKAEALLACVIRLPKAEGFEIQFSPLSGLDCESALESATRMNTAIEQAILAHPEQYHWIYHRFSRQPDDKPSPYRSS